MTPAFADIFERARRRVRETPLNRHAGHVVRSVGLAIECHGPRVAVGEEVRLESADGELLSLAEVVAMGMFELSSAAASIVLFLIGIALSLLTYGITRRLPRHKPNRSTMPAPASKNVSAHQEAVLLVQNGGRVVYMNRPAREMFGAWEAAPNLESLARRTRPSETFLTLCAAEGRGRFSLNGHFVEGTSYFMPGIIPGVAKNNATPQAAMLVSLRRHHLILNAYSEKDTDPSGASAGEGDSQTADVAGGNGTAVVEGEAPVVNTPETTIVEAPNRAFGILYELTQNMTASLDLEATLTAVLESVEQLLPSARDPRRLRPILPVGHDPVQYRPPH